MALANISILKTSNARAIRFSTLDAICEERKPMNTLLNAHAFAWREAHKNLPKDDSNET